MYVNSTLIHGESVLHTNPIQYTYNKECISLSGSYNDQHLSLSISQDILSKQTLLLGGTGSGKTNVFYYFVSQIKKSMSKDDVMIIFDTKGDFYRKFYNHGDILIANSKAFSKISSKWNIYKEILIDGWENDDIINNTHEIVHSFFREAIEKTNQQFFPSAARDLFAAMLIAQIRLGKNDLNFKQKFLNNKALKHNLDTLSPQKIIDNLSPNMFSDLSSVLAYIGDGKTSQSLGVLAELQNAVQQILIGTFVEDGHFSIREFVRNKDAKTLFIEYDLSIGETLTPIYRLLFDLALKEAMGRNKSEGNVYLICDEFKLLPNLKHIEDGVNFGRSLGVKIIAGIQSIDQMYEIYGQSKARNIIAGFSSIYSFKVNDSATREFITNLYGKNLILDQYKTSNNVVVEEKRDGKTVEDWDVNNLKIGEAIIGLPFEKPFKFRFDLFRG